MPPTRSREAADEGRRVEGDLPDNTAREPAKGNGATCPRDGSPMIASPVPDERRLVKDMVSRGSQTAYASNVAAGMHEKEQQHGVIYTCPTCGYVMRVKDAA